MKLIQHSTIDLTGSTSDNCLMLNIWFTADSSDGSFNLRHGVQDVTSKADIKLRYTCDEVKSTNWFDRWVSIPYLDCGCDISSRLEVTYAIILMNAFSLTSITCTDEHLIIDTKSTCVSNYKHKLDFVDECEWTQYINSISTVYQLNRNSTW